MKDDRALIAVFFICSIDLTITLPPCLALIMIRNVQLKAVTIPAQPSDLLTAMAPKSTPTSFDVTATPRKKKSLFAGLVKKDESTSSGAGSSSIQDKDSKATGKRKAEDDVKIEKVAAVDNKKAKAGTTTAATTSKPNALLALAAYDSSSDEDA